MRAHKKQLGIWPYLGRILLPMEVRFLKGREIPLSYYADMERHLLYSLLYNSTLSQAQIAVFEKEYVQMK